MKKRFFFVFLILILFICSCEKGTFDFYLSGMSPVEEEDQYLFKLLEEGPENAEQKLIILKKIQDFFSKHKKEERTNLLLSQELIKEAEDPYNAYYLYQLGNNYLKKSATPFAIFYYERLINNHPDLLYQNESIHFLTLEQLVRLLDDPQKRLVYLQLLMNRFHQKIQPGYFYYQLGQCYENLGEWPQAVQAYRQFLAYPNVTIPGDTEAKKKVQSFINFYTSEKSWTRNSLEGLVNQIKDSVLKQDMITLEALMSKVNFFILSWEGKKRTRQIRKMDPVNFIRTFLDISITYNGRSSIRFNNELDETSSESEAFLRSSGWKDYRIGIWYFYFRRVYFPADANINGRWEWAGIYLGEKL